MVSLRTCSACQAQVATSAKACPSCGARTSAGRAADRMRLILIFVLVLIVLLVLYGVLADNVRNG